MKIRKIIVMAGVCILCLGALAGCGSDGGSKTAGGTGTGSTGTSGDTEAGGTGAPGDAEAGGTGGSGGYVFEANGVKIAVDADMGPIAEALGEPSSYFEEPSCAAQGIAKLYTYPGFTVETYPEGEKDLVASVILKDDTVATPEGVDLSMTRDKVIEVYGDGGQEAEGSLTYEKGGMKLRFILEGEYIAAIEYNSAVLD